MRHHYRNHGEKSHQCDQCGYTTQHRNSLIIHALKHTEERPHNCDHLGCKGRFKDLKSLNLHKQIHQESNYECFFCGKRYQSRDLIRNHMLQHSSSKTENYRCETCEKSYKSKKTLIVHMKNHGGYQSFICKLCTKSYATASALRVHNRSAHLKIRYTCKFCDRLFANHISLFEHLFSHRGDKPVRICFFYLFFYGK
jgi:uncharacterized Zn-finger protein